MQSIADENKGRFVLAFRTVTGGYRGRYVMYKDARPKESFSFITVSSSVEFSSCHRLHTETMKFLTFLPLIAFAAADTLDVRLWADTDCSGSSFQTFTIGNTNECHDASRQFNSVKTENVAQSFFNSDLHLIVFRNPGCTGESAFAALTNKGTCDVREGLSFMVA